MKEIGRPVWLFGGTAVVVLFCASLMTARVMTPLVPMPTHQVLLAWTTGFLYLLVLPIIYFASLPALWNATRRGEIILALIALLAVATIYWFMASWEYGYKYQGATHTQLVATENAIGICAAAGLSVAGLLKKTRTMQLAAYLLMFVLLSWCAFPYLGELP